jgi:hypothetical protein
MDYKFISVKDAKQYIRDEVKSIRTHSNFDKCIASFKLYDDDNVIPLFNMILDNPEKFKDYKNYPTTWTKFTSIASGVSSINRCIKCKKIIEILGKEHINKITTLLNQYIQTLQKTKNDYEESESTTESIDANESIINDEQIFETNVIYNLSCSQQEQLIKENKILKFKNELLYNFMTQTAEDHPKYKKWFDITCTLLDKLN